MCVMQSDAYVMSCHLRKNTLMFDGAVGVPSVKLCVSVQKLAGYLNPEP